MLRSFLEKATRRSAFRRSLPAAVGGASIYTSGSAGLKYLFRPMDSVDPVLCGLAVELVSRGSVVWDIGANVGLFTFAAAHLAGTAGRVLAVDADTWLIQLLRRSAALQPPTSAAVTILPAAIAQACDVRTFNISSRSRATNFLEGYGSSQAGGVAERHTVLSVSLDWLATRAPAPQVIKIDVEGAELEVLRGGIGLLAAARPTLICEVGAESSDAVGELLGGLGYRLYDGEAERAQRREQSAAPWTTVAVHG